MKRIYHYTSVGSLFKILKSGNLRFNNLTNMDDPQEKESREFNNIGRWTFISSWTSLYDMRRMYRDYGDNLYGVCLSLPVNPFFKELDLKPYANNKEIQELKYPFKSYPTVFTKGLKNIGIKMISFSFQDNYKLLK